jgi:hypothetical protein
MNVNIRDIISHKELEGAFLEVLTNTITKETSNFKLKIDKCLCNILEENRTINSITTGEKNYIDTLSTNIESNNTSLTEIESIKPFLAIINKFA